MMQAAQNFLQCDGCDQTLTAPFYYLKDVKCYSCALECVVHDMFTATLAGQFRALLEPYFSEVETANIEALDTDTAKCLAEDALIEALANLHVAKVYTKRVKHGQS